MTDYLGQKPNEKEIAHMLQLQEYNTITTTITITQVQQECRPKSLQMQHVLHFSR